MLGSLACVDLVFAAVLAFSGPPGALPCLGAAAGIRLAWAGWGWRRGVLLRKPNILFLDVLRGSEVAKLLHDRAYFIPAPPGSLDADPAVFLDGVLLDAELGLPASWLRRLMREWRRVPLYDAGEVLEHLAGRVSAQGAREVDFSRDPTPGSTALLKRVFDVVVCLLALPITAPGVLMAALAIRLDSPGHVLYRQKRVGRGGRTFEMLKLRTMRVHPDTGRAAFTRENDGRITRVGRFLRVSSLDELPQLWNVLCGDMSLVGPRPEQVPFARAFEAKLSLYGQRHRVRPGITGWAQVEQGYVSSVEGTVVKLEYDLYYVRHLSLAFDLRILARTVPVVLGRFGRR